LLAAALLADCRLFISEELQHGREISGMRIANPFTKTFATAITA
jgi:predicted nucleic acid-binding protein